MAEAAASAESVAACWPASSRLYYTHTKHMSTLSSLHVPAAVPCCAATGGGGDGDVTTGVSGARQVLRVRVDWSDVGLKCPLTGG